MRSLRESFHSTPVAVTAFALLVLGIAVHALLNQPRIEEVAGLRGRHANLVGQAGQLVRLQRETQDLERFYGGEGGTSVEANASVDPLAFIGRAVDAARLKRIEMGTEASATTGGLRVTKFSLRVSGTYPHIVDFVRTLEQGSRTVTIHSLAMELMPETDQLEARLHLSVFDPIARL